MPAGKEDEEKEEEGEARWSDVSARFSKEEEERDGGGGWELRTFRRLGWGGDTSFAAVAVAVAGSIVFPGLIPCLGTVPVVVVVGSPSLRVILALSLSPSLSLS